MIYFLQAREKKEKLTWSGTARSHLVPIDFERSIAILTT
jgi:hypothetical protein